MKEQMNAANKNKSVSWDTSVNFSKKDKNSSVVKIQKNSVTFPQLKSIALRNLETHDIRKKICRGSKNVVLRVHFIKCKKNSLFPNPNSCESYWETESHVIFVTVEEKSVLIGLYESIDTSNGFSLMRVSDDLVCQVISHFNLNCSKIYEPWSKYNEGKGLLPSNNRVKAIELV